MASQEKFKIEVILKSSPEKVKSDTKDRLAKYPKDNNNNNVLYKRSPSLPTQNDKTIDLRTRIISQKQCLARPTSQK